MHYHLNISFKFLLPINEILPFGICVVAMEPVVMVSVVWSPVVDTNPPPPLVVVVVGELLEVDDGELPVVDDVVVDVVVVVFLFISFIVAIIIILYFGYFYFFIFIYIF